MDSFSATDPHLSVADLTSITTSTVTVLLPAVAVFLLLVTSTLRAASRRKIRGVAHLKLNC